jgi:AcrR family transcriptional regulator
VPRPDAPAAPSAVAAAKGERTRQLIVDTALQLFRELGYEATTMRAIATAAGVSVGNAYYYFPSKQHLVQAYYDHSQSVHVEAARSVLDTATSFEDRLRGVLMTRIDTMQSEKDFAVDLFRYAADHTSPLSPFSKESTPSREASMGLYVEAVQGAQDLKLPADLRDTLPELLWLYQMGVVLYWVHDTSRGSKNTYALADRTVPIVVKLVNLARYRLLKGLTSDLLELVRDLRPKP